MAHFVYDDPSITFNGVDITDFVTQCTITQNYITNRILTFGQSGRTDIISSKQDNSVTIALVQDFDAGGVDATVGAAVGGKGTLVVSPGTAVTSPTNPKVDRRRVHHRVHAPRRGPRRSRQPNLQLADRRRLGQSRRLMARPLQKARVLIAKGPTAEPEWSDITFSIGLLARWEMEGPKREDGTFRTVTSFLQDSRQCDIGWLAWIALGQSDEFETWLLKLLNFEWVATEGSDDDTTEDPDED